MSKLWSKNVPQAVYIRKGILYVIIAFIIAIALFVFIGLMEGDKGASQDKNHASKNDVQNVATDSDTDWAKQAAQKASVVPQKPQNSPTSKSQVITKKSQLVSAVASSSDNTNQNSQQNEALIKAMAAPISSQQITNDQGAQAIQSTQNNVEPSLLPNGSPTMPGQQQQDQNMQSEKKAFLQINGQPNLKDDYLNASLQNPLSQYELQAGTIIPGIMITGINSDLPGQITGQVRTNIYDSISGKYLLVPQGSKLTGLYDSQIAYGQERVLIAWKRIIFPNGQSIDLQGMPGVDISGYAGFNDQVNNHYFKIFGSVVLMSLLSAGAQLSQPQNQNTNPLVINNPTVGQTLAQSLGTNIANTATALTQKNINIQPTLEIRPGYEFNISVTKDMVFPNAYTG